MLMSTEGRAEGGGKRRRREAGLLQAWPEGPGKGEHCGLRLPFIPLFAFSCIRSLTHSLVCSSVYPFTHLCIHCHSSLACVSA